MSNVFLPFQLNVEWIFTPLWCYRTCICFLVEHIFRDKDVKSLIKIVLYHARESQKVIIIKICFFNLSVVVLFFGCKFECFCKALDPRETTQLRDTPQRQWRQPDLLVGDLGPVPDEVYLRGPPPRAPVPRHHANVNFKIHHFGGFYNLMLRIFCSK